MTEPLLDQIPVLADVRRYLDELALMEVPEPTAGGGGRGAGGGGAPGLLLVEQVAQLRAGILAGVALKRRVGRRCKEGEDKMWEGLALMVLKENFGTEGGDARDQDLRRLASLYSCEWVDEVVASATAGAIHGGSNDGQVTVAEEKEEGGGEGRHKGRLCSNCGKEASKRCGRCNIASEWYCCRQCQVAKWKSHKPACDTVVSARAV